MKALLAREGWVFILNRPLGGEGVRDTSAARPSPAPSAKARLLQTGGFAADMSARRDDGA
jgi:hypothetical protein